MKIRAAIASAMICVTVGSAQVAAAERNDCDTALRSYNRASREISYAIRRYSLCISANTGREDYESAFRGLRTAQSHFQAAVIMRRRDC